MQPRALLGAPPSRLELCWHRCTADSVHTDATAATGMWTIFGQRTVGSGKLREAPVYDFPEGHTPRVTGDADSLTAPPRSRFREFAQRFGFGYVTTRIRSL